MFRAKSLLLLLILIAVPFPTLAQRSCSALYPVDLFINFNGATPGTPASSSNLAASTEGTYSSVTANSSMLLAASQVSLPYDISVNGGSEHVCNYATQSLEVTAGSTMTTSVWYVSGAPTEIVASGIIVLPSTNPSSGALIDLELSYGTNYVATIDISPGVGGYCGAYGVGIEVSNDQQGDQVSRTNPCNTSVVSGVPYWFTHHTIWAAGKTCVNGTVSSPCTEMNVYSVSNNLVGAQVGSTVGIALPGTNGGFSRIWFGNNENGSPQSNYYFQDWGVNWTKPIFPQLPQLWVPMLYPTSSLNTLCNPIDQTSAGQCAWPYWVNAGVPGGIPSASYTQSGSTLSPSGGSDSSAINSALSSCGGTSSQGKYVLLGPGTFSITAGLTVPSYCVLRGSGANSTILNATLTSGNVVNMGNVTPSTSNRVSMTGGTNAGSTSVTVSSGSGFSVGQLVSISQVQDGVIVNNVGSEGTCTWCDGFENDSGLRAQGQTDLVTGVNGTSITLAEPLMVNYTSTPEITPYSPGATNAGLENLQIYANGTRSGGTTNGNVYMLSCLYCWVSGIEDNYADGDHIFADYSYHGEVVNSYFSNDYYHDAGQNDDSITLRLKTTGFLIQNNILERMMSTIETEWGAAGNVIAYNYSFSGFLYGSPNFLNQDMNTHGAHEQFNLFEGNVVESLGQDSIWGSDANNTYFRNWMEGVSRLCDPVSEGRNTVTCSSPYYTNQADRAFSANALNTNTNVIGNVEGSTGQSSIGSGVALAVAVCGPSPCGSGSRTYQSVYYNEDYGYGTSSDTGTQSIDSILPYDTTFRHGEYGTVNNSILWQTGYTQTLPISFYLSAKPSWWPSAVSWPAIGPDVTGGTGPGGHVSSTTAANAAQYCYTAIMGGSDGGAGSPLTFNPASCYAASSQAPTAPAIGIFTELLKETNHEKGVL